MGLTALESNDDLRAEIINPPYVFVRPETAHLGNIMVLTRATPTCLKPRTTVWFL